MAVEELEDDAAEFMLLHSMMSVLPNGGEMASYVAHLSFQLHSMMSVLPNGGKRVAPALALQSTLHSMMSVLPNGGLPAAPLPVLPSAALDDVSATEWRCPQNLRIFYGLYAALDDVSATEWRAEWSAAGRAAVEGLHSMMSVLPNGGFF